VNLSLDEAIQRYLEHLSIERGLAENTLAAYGSDLARFAAWATDQGIRDAGRVTTPDLNRYLLARLDDGTGARTMARNIVSLRRFFRFLRTENLLEVDPAALLDVPRVHRSLPRSWSGCSAPPKPRPTRGSATARCSRSSTRPDSASRSLSGCR
jgi:integrase/recombinase XerD